MLLTSLSWYFFGSLTLMNCHVPEAAFAATGVAAILLALRLGCITYKFIFEYAKQASENSKMRGNNSEMDFVATETLFARWLEYSLCPVLIITAEHGLVGDDLLCCGLCAK